MYRGLGRYSRLSPFEKLRLTVSEAIRALNDPYLAGESIAALGETTGEFAVMDMHTRMSNNPVGKRILKDKPGLDAENLDLSKMRTLPPRSLGACFVRYMDMHGFEIGDRPKVKYIEDPELAYVMKRYRETHDMLHAVCGLPVSVSGEIGLKWFEMIQTGLPMTSLAAFFGTLKSERTVNPTLLGNDFMIDYIGYCATAAKKSDFFLNIYFEECWEEDINSFRKRIHLPELPLNLPSLDASWDPRRVALMKEHYTAALAALEGSSETSRKEAFENYLKALEA